MLREATSSSPLPRTRYRNSAGTVVRVTCMVTAPSAADVVAEGAGGDVLAGDEAVADGGALTSGFGVGVGVETTEESGLLTPT